MSFERFFLWSMRNGARILFLLSLLLIFLGLGPYLFMLLGESSRLASNHQATFGMSIEWFAFVNAVFTILNSATLPFLGAVLIHLAERFLSGRAGVKQTQRGDADA